MTDPTKSISPESTKSAELQGKLRSVRGFAKILDDLIRIPGTKISIGLDPVINLIPFAGDAVGTMMSATLLFTAFKTGVPKRVLGRMLLNIGIDSLVGAIPVFGQAFDFVWKANTKNMELLERYATTPEATKKASGFIVVIVVGTLLAITALTLFCGYWFLRWIASLLNLPLI